MQKRKELTMVSSRSKEFRACPHEFRDRYDSQQPGEKNDETYDGDVDPYKAVHGRSFAQKIWKHTKTGHYVCLAITHGNYYGLLTVAESDVIGDWDLLDVHFNPIIREFHQDLSTAIQATVNLLRENPQCIHTHGTNQAWQKTVAIAVGGRIEIIHSTPEDVYG